MKPQADLAASPPSLVSALRSAARVFLNQYTMLWGSSLGRPARHPALFSSRVYCSTCNTTQLHGSPEQNMFDDDKKYFVCDLRPAGVVVEVEPLLQQRDLVLGVEADAQPRLALLPHSEEVLIQTPA